MARERGDSPQLGLGDFLSRSLQPEFVNSLAGLYLSFDRNQSIKISPDIGTISSCEINFRFSYEKSSLDPQYGGRFVVEPGKYSKDVMLSRAEVKFNPDRRDVISWIYELDPDNPVYSRSTSVILPGWNALEYRMLFIKVEEGNFIIVDEDGLSVDSGRSRQAMNVHAKALDVCSFAIQTLDKIPSPSTF